MPSAVVFGRSLPFDRGVSFSKHAFGGDFPTPFHSLYRRNISPLSWDIGYRCVRAPRCMKTPWAVCMALSGKALREAAPFVSLRAGLIDSPHSPLI
ncbi:hypothetical protein [Cupriavidus oxalaticus]|uniref:hypothetical protein n=1 Tax=Cupriavidus oxalaticus TaxID=96344 RepID=UPI004034F607